MKARDIKEGNQILININQVLPLKILENPDTRFFTEPHCFCKLSAGQWKGELTLRLFIERFRQVEKKRGHPGTSILLTQVPDFLIGANQFFLHEFDDN